MIVLIFAALLGLIPGAVASKKGRPFILWWLYGALVFPIALIHAIVAKPMPVSIDHQQARAGNKKCPNCAEWIRPDANACRYCGAKA